MWGTSSPDDKLTGDLGNVIETTQIGGRRSDRLMAGKLSPGDFGLLQQYPPKADKSADESLSLLCADCVAEVCGYSSEAAASISRDGFHHPLFAER
jgi:hypothetical protein